MRRGEVWTAATGSGFGSKPRPVVVVQGETFAQTPNVIVALCQTASGDPDDVRPRIVADRENGLDHLSDVAVDLLVAVPRHKFGRYVGRLSNNDRERVDMALLIFLGFADR